MANAVLKSKIQRRGTDQFEDDKLDAIDEFVEIAKPKGYANVSGCTYLVRTPDKWRRGSLAALIP